MTLKEGEETVIVISPNDIFEGKPPPCAGPGWPAAFTGALCGHTILFGINYT